MKMTIHIHSESEKYYSKMHRLFLGVLFKAAEVFLSKSKKTGQDPTDSYDIREGFHTLSKVRRDSDL